MTDAEAPGNEPTAAAARDSSGRDADPALAAEEVVDESDAKLPAPLNNGAYRKILKELPDGPRIAAETCVQFWKDKKFPTEELVAFLKTISVHSPSLKKGFDDQHNGFLRAMKLQVLACFAQCSHAPPVLIYMYLRAPSQRGGWRGAVFLGGGNAGHGSRSALGTWATAPPPASVCALRRR
jgi:hypothetical protein